MSSQDQHLFQKARRLTRQAQLYLLWEQYGPVFAKTALFSTLFLIGSFCGLWQWIGDPWRLIVLAIAIFHLITALRQAMRQTPPNRSAAQRRVEQDSNIQHRPLDTLYDRPAINNTGWSQHYDKAKQVIENLKAPKLKPVFANMDKYYLRFSLPVGLLLALMIGTGDSLERLRHSLSPDWISGAINDNISFEAWLDPPEYTGRPPLYFKNTNHLEAPEGSELVARIIGTPDPTRLRLQINNRTKHLKLTQISPDSFEVRVKLDGSAKAHWRIGQHQHVWTIKTRPDRPPTINFVRNPEADKRDRLTFSYDLTDDYGVQKLTLEMTLLQDDPEAPIQTRDIAVFSDRNIGEAKDESSAIDLTKHEWAGQKVSGKLIATDGLEQQANSQTVYFTVPDKIFIEPLAKAIIEQRQLVMAGQKPYQSMPKPSYRQNINQPWFDTYEPEWRLERAPKEIERAVLLIDAITDRPENLFKDPAVYMGLRHTVYNLRYAQNVSALDGIPKDLWDIAIRAEFGILGTALQEMQEAEAALRDGIARRAPEREIDTLFDRYNEAVDRYRDELLQAAIEDGNVAEAGGGGAGENMKMDEIQALLDAIEEANRQGDTESARRALAQLAELLENMQIQLTQGGSGSGETMPDGMSEDMQEALEELADLLGEQRELRDKTRETEQADTDQQSQNAQGQGDQNSNPMNEGGSSATIATPDELARQQGQLQELLDNTQNALQNNPNGQNNPDGQTANGGKDEGEDGIQYDPQADLDAARQAMQEAEGALQSGEFGEAQDQQQTAIQALRHMGKNLIDQAQKAQGQTDQAGSSDIGDPLGRDRAHGESMDNSETDLNNLDNASRSRELQDEIRRRAAEQERQSGRT